MAATESNGIKRHLWGAVAAILVGLFLQTMGAFYWAGKISARMDGVERDLGRVYEVVYRPTSP